jgi:hypothetical protein
MIKPTSTVYSEHPRITHIESGIFLVSADKHSAVAVSKESIKDVEYLKPLSKIGDVSAFEMEDDKNFLYFESHINQAIINSLVPAVVYKKLCRVTSFDKASTGCEIAKNIVKDAFPSYYEAMHGIELSSNESRSIREAEFYSNNQNTYLVKSLEHDYSLNPDEIVDGQFVKFKAVKLSEGEIYGHFCPTYQSFRISMEDYKSKVKPNLIQIEYPSNSQRQILLPANVIELCHHINKIS